MDYGRLDEVARWITAAERRSTERDAMQLAILRVVHRYKAGDLEAAAAAARRAVALAEAEPKPSFALTVALCELGVTRFWQGRTSRLHDRLRYVTDATGGWRRERLAP